MKTYKVRLVKKNTGSRLTVFVVARTSSRAVEKAEESLIGWETYKVFEQVEE